MSNHGDNDSEDSLPPLSVPASPSRSRGHTHASQQAPQHTKSHNDPSSRNPRMGQRADVTNESPRSDSGEAHAGTRNHACLQAASSDANGVAAQVSCPSVADAPHSANAEANQPTTIKLQKALLANKQLLYVKVKQASFNPLNFAIFKDTTNFQQEFLAQLAAIPTLESTGIFKPESLYFSLHKHVHSSARKLKGFLYTACFALQKSDLNLQELILHTQKTQDKQCFSFNLPAFSSAHPKDPAKTVKSKVLFSLDLQSLLDTFMLEFQVKIPPIVSTNPIRDFATLVVELLYPPDQRRSEIPPEFIKNERTRFESYCNPLAHTLSDKGVIISNLMSGHIPLNLDDSESPDFQICQRLIFASYFGLDMRPGHYQQYKLLLPVLADQAQLKLKPAAFKDLAESMRDTLSSHPGITAPRRSRQRSRNPSSNSSSSSASTSESESEELFLARSLARNAVLNVLDPVPIPEQHGPEYPHFSTVSYTRHEVSHLFSAQHTIQGPSEKPLCKFFVLGRCKHGTACQFLHELLSHAAMSAFQQRAAQLIGSAEAEEAAQDMVQNLINVATSTTASPHNSQAASAQTTATAKASHDVVQQLFENATKTTASSHDSQAASFHTTAAHMGTLNDRVIAAQSSIERLRVAFPGHGDDDYDVTDERFDPISLPTAAQCSKASVIPNSGNGDCLWIAFIEAYKLLPMTSRISMDPKTSATELRSSTLHFLKANRNKKILPTLALPHSVVTLTSPEAHLRSQQNFKFITDSKGRKVKCSCPNGLHLRTCNGQRFGEIQMMGSKPLPYTSFDEYFDIMIRPGAFAEDLEIMALAARFNVNFVIWQPLRGSDNSIAHYYRANSKTLIALKSANGWGHYETLSFSNLPETADSTVVLGTPATPPRVQNRDSPANSRNLSSQNASECNPVRAWLKLKLHNTRAKLFTPDKSLVILQSPTTAITESYITLAKVIDDNLHIPAALLNPEEPCLSSCVCKDRQVLTTQRPTFYSPFCSFQFKLIADTLLKCVSMTFFLDCSPEEFHLLASHLFVRITQIAATLLGVYFDDLFALSDECLTSLRTSLLMMTEAIRIINSPGRVLLESQLETFRNNGAQTLTLIQTLIEILEMTMTDRFNLQNIPDPTIGQMQNIVASLSQPQSQQSQQSQISRSSQASDSRPLLIDFAIATHFEQICAKLADDAEKAASLAQDRLTTVSDDNSMIARLQLQTLQNDLSSFNAFCSNIAKGYESIAPQFSRAQVALGKMQECARRIATSTLIVDEAAASPRFKRNSPSSSSKGGKKTPSAKAKHTRPILGEREMAQQTTLAQFFTNIGQTANSLRLLDKPPSRNTSGGIALFSDYLEYNIRDLEAQGLCEFEAAEALLENRKQHNSTASRFMPEAHNINSTQQSDSFDSHDSFSERSSDREFVRSQGSEIQDAHNPRFLQAQREIREAAKTSIADEILAVQQVNNLPQGFCSRGHPYDSQPKLKKGKTAICSHCSQAFAEGGIFTCSCSSYACIHCLVGKLTSPPPPNCPNLQCTGTCTMRFKPIETLCFAGNHSIPKNERFWMCFERRCMTIICTQCASKTVNPQSSTQAAPSHFPPASQNASTASGPPLPNGNNAAQ